MVFAARICCALRREENEFVDKRRRAHIERRQKPLRCAAKRYTQAKIHFDKAFCGTFNQPRERLYLETI